MSDRLTPEREAEIAAAVTELDTNRMLSFGTWTASPVTEKTTLPPEQAFAVEDVAQIGNATIRGSVGVFGDERHAAFTALARTAVSALLAELAAVRAERDQTLERVTELGAASRQGSDRWRARCDYIARQGLRWKAEAEGRKKYGESLRTRVTELEENLRAVNAGWSVSRARVAELEAAQQPATEDDASDNRRRIYIDGKGCAWIDAGIDSGGLQWIAPIDGAAMEATREAVNAETGALREIGRCW